VSLLNRIRHYRGLGGALERIELLLQEFSFGAIASYLPTMEGQAAMHSTKGAA
jgi:hypothetical protein